MKNKKRHYVHGECNLFEVDSIPVDAKKIIPTKEQLAKNGFIVAKSESVGNHHCIAVNDGIEFYEDDKGTLYMRNTKPTNIFCVHEGRHDTITIPPSTWKRKIAKQFDYLANIKREVAD